MEVTVKPEETLEIALKRFRRKCNQSGVLKEVRNRAYYVKPSERRREALRKAKRRALKKRR